MAFLHTIINSGIGFANTPSVKRGVQLSNAISLILFTLSFLTAIPYYIWYGWNFVTFFIPLIGVLGLLVILLNYAGHINSSRLWISVAPYILISFLSIYSKRIYYDQQQELDYFTFRIVMLGSCVIPWVVFSMKEKKLLILSSAIGLAILMAHDPLHTAFGVPYQQDKLKVLNYYFTNIVIFMTAGILIGSLSFLKWISEKNEDKSIELIKDLNHTNEILLERNSEIEAQSTEILAQSDILYSHQNQLLEANRLIEEQRKLLLNKNQSLESELLEKNADLTETNTELIKHNTELRQFSYTVSHNLRGPVASLLGLVNLVDLSKLVENDREIFSFIETATLQLDQIIKDLTKIIDIRHDIFKIRQKINIESEVDDIVQILRREFEEHNVRLVKNLGACEQLYSIKPMVNSILYNLMSNAIKYRSNERQPVIEIVTREDEEYYVLEVKDNGLGIDLKKNKENLFKLYKRFHFHTEGKGLGLYLIKLQSESLGGHVEIESELNRYTKFTVQLKKPLNIDRQLLYQESHAEIFFDASINATGVIWKETVTSEQYRSVFKKCLEFVLAYNTPNYISDITHQGPVDKDDQRWMFEEILPFAIRNGLRKIAAVRADVANPLVKEYLKGINENLGNLGAAHMAFATLEDAVEWIRLENEKPHYGIKND